MHHQNPQPPPSSRSDVVVKIDGGDDSSSSSSPTPVGRDSSLEFWRNDASRPPESDFNVDPPSKLIGQFLSKQKAAGGEMSLDVDLDMDELRTEGSTRSRSRPILSPIKSKDLNRFQEIPSSRRGNVVDSSPDIQSRISSDSSSDNDESHQILSQRRSSNIVCNADLNSNGRGNESMVLRCTSIQRRCSGIGSVKTRSRLMDPPEFMEKRSETMKSGQLPQSGYNGRPSGMLATAAVDTEEEDDPLFDDDIPDEYRRNKIDALTVLEWIFLIAIMSILACTLLIHEWKRKEFRGLSMWKWAVLVLVLICGRLVSGWVIRIAVFFIERNFFMRKRVLYFVYGIKRAVQNCIWLGLVIFAWHSVFDRELQVNNKFLWYVNRLMICMIVGTLLWLVKTLMVKVLASSFHVSTFFDRIQESLFNQFAIETLSGPPLIEMRNQQEEDERTMAEVRRLQNGGAMLPPDLRTLPPKSGKLGTTPSGRVPSKSPRVSFRGGSDQPPKNQDDQGISIDKLHKLNHENVSAWNMKRLIRIVKNGLLTTLDERVLYSSQGDEKDDKATQIKSEREAKAAARKIFKNVAQPKAKFIYPKDLMRFLREEDAIKVLNIVEGPESEKISKASLRSWVVNTFVERRALALTLNDTKTAVNKLHRMVDVIMGIIIFVLCLVILDLTSGKSLLYVTSQIVVVAFIFGNTLKTVFEAVIFVFVIHPFDVGDRCEIDGIQMVVEEMNILTTVFLKYDYLKITYPNATLATKPIHNFYRSPDMGDAIDFVIHIATPADKLALMKQRITSHIESRSDHWYPEPTVVVLDLVGLNALKLSVWLRHRMNHQNIGEKYRRRALLVEEMVKIFKELDIEFRLYPIDINVRAMPPLNPPTRIPSASSLPPLAPTSGN